MQINTYATGSKQKMLKLKCTGTYLVVVVEFPAPLCPTSRVVLGFQYLAYEAFILQLYPTIGLIMM